MYLISHRGNINGIQKSKENDPSYINKAIETIIHNSIDLLQGSHTNFMNNLNGDLNGV